MNYSKLLVVLIGCTLHASDPLTSVTNNASWETSLFFTKIQKIAQTPELDLMLPGDAKHPLLCPDTLKALHGAPAVLQDLALMHMQLLTERIIYLTDQAERISLRNALDWSNACALPFTNMPTPTAVVLSWGASLLSALVPYTPFHRTTTTFKRLGEVLKHLRNEGYRPLITNMETFCGFMDKDKLLHSVDMDLALTLQFTPTQFAEYVRRVDPHNRMRVISYTGYYHTAEGREPDEDAKTSTNF